MSDERIAPTTQSVAPDTLAAASKIFEEIERHSSPARQQGFEYEKLAIEYSHRGFQNLTYLNGGALVAIPTALAFFKTDLRPNAVMATALMFILGLVAVVVAQCCAFYVMARRSEAMANIRDEHIHTVVALANPTGSQTQKDYLSQAATLNGIATKQLRSSDLWRRIGLCCFTISLLMFLLGCTSGAYVVLLAKQKGIVVSD
jgi:hypothetical protein